MSDLTVIYITANRVPKKWESYQMDVLKKALLDNDVITISREPMDFGQNILDVEPLYNGNFPRQLFRGIEKARTKYIALAEDDTLYTSDHFMFRPNLDRFFYSFNRYILYLWDPQFYYKLDQLAGAGMICNRNLALDALGDRIEKYPNGLPRDRYVEFGYERRYPNLGLNFHSIGKFKQGNPIVQVEHLYFSSMENNHYNRSIKRNKQKPHHYYDEIPYWGKTENIIRYFQ
jgi:hypothetical protein